MKKAIYSFLVILCGCTQTPPPAPLAVKHWTPQEQRQILAAEKKLPPDSILITVLIDYAHLRREVENADSR